jgi:5'-AMP-activated protein kinase, catalytic alpha subunit
VTFCLVYIQSQSLIIIPTTIRHTENLLFDDRKCIKIIDFGFGNNFSMDSLLDTFCGSPFYAAPEMILGKKYEGPEVDMWSLGIIMYALLCGHLPFDDDNMKELYKKIASGQYTCPDYLMPSKLAWVA